MKNTKKGNKSLKDYVKGKTLSGQVPNKLDFSPELDTKRIQEAKESTAVFAFGRFNPPTVGHEKIIHKVHQIAKDHDGKAHIVASHTQGTSKDPLPQDKKLEYLHKVAPEGVHVSGSSKEHPNFLTAAKKLHDAGHKHLVMVAGSDRVDNYRETLHKYNGKEGHYNFKSIKVVSAGQRDPDSEGVEGMSGTKMRAHARAGEHEKFKSGLPKALHPHAKEISDQIRSVKESAEEILEAVLTIAQRRKRAINLKRREPRIQRQKVLALKRFATEKALRRRSRNLARDLARTRFAGKRGASYNDLSPSDKIAVDRQLQGKDKLITALANRLYQRVRRREMIRVSKMRSGVKGSIGKQKTGLVAASFDPGMSKELFESVFNKVMAERFNVNPSQLVSLTEKSIASNISLFEILEQYKQGTQSWEATNKHTPEQLGFNNVNSLVAKFKSSLSEDAASHIRQAADAQKKGQYAKANLHRKIAGALARGDNTTAKGYMSQLSSVKEEDDQQEAKTGLWANIHAKRARIKAGSGERMRKPGSKGAPTKQDFIDAQESKTLEESFCIDRPTGLGVMYTAADLGIETKGGFAYHPSVIEKMIDLEFEEMEENFMDGRNPEDKGDMARHGLKSKSITQLKKIRSSDSATPRQKQLAHWYINMHKGKK